MQLAERALVPAAGVLDIDDLADGRRRGRGDAAALDRHRRRVGRGLEQVEQGCSGLLGAGQRGLEPSEVAGDEFVTSGSGPGC